MTMRVDEILEALSDVDLRLRNLFELDYDTANEPMAPGWQCNVASRDEHVGYEFGRGRTPLAALVAACKAAGVNVEDAAA